MTRSSTRRCVIAGRSWRIRSCRSSSLSPAWRTLSPVGSTGHACSTMCRAVPGNCTCRWPSSFARSSFRRVRMDLKLFRLKDPSALDLLQSQTATKIRAIEPLLTAFPERRFVLIGDSGEQDPEIYTEIARTHRPQIVAVFIRNVTGRAVGRCALPHLTTGTRGCAVSAVRAGGRTAAHHGGNQPRRRRLVTPAFPVRVNTQPRRLSTAAGRPKCCARSRSTCGWTARRLPCRSC